MNKSISELAEGKELGSNPLFAGHRNPAKLRPAAGFAKATLSLENQLTVIACPCAQSDLSNAMQPSRPV